MTPDDRCRLRAALRIHDRLCQSPASKPTPLLPLDAWRELVAATRKIVLAEERGWANAVRVARSDFRRVATFLSGRLAESAHNGSDVPRPSRIQTPREILADLVALDTEFEDVEIDLQLSTVALTAEAIVLEGMDLGRFQIVLHWNELPAADAYAVIALDPHPAGSDETTTHPHVRDDKLCEGEGRLPIRRALEQGRLFDFALLVRGVLTTYNAGSAYVALSQWEGNSCSDCGYLAAEDDATSCDHCGSDLCCDCSTSCADCCRSCCGDCRDRCQICDESHCTSCLRTCADCDESHCRGCLTAGRCRACREADDTDTTDDCDITLPIPQLQEPFHGSTSTAINIQQTRLVDADAPGTSLHPVRLGEAAVSA